MTPIAFVDRDERALPRGVAEARGRAERLHSHDRAAPRARRPGDLGAHQAAATPTTSTWGRTRTGTASAARSSRPRRISCSRAISARIHRRPVERLKEDTYFFRLSRYTEPLLRLYESAPSSSRPRAGATRSSASCRRASRTSPSRARSSRGASPCRATRSTSCTSGSTRSRTTGARSRARTTPRRSGAARAPSCTSWARTSCAFTRCTGRRS